MKQLFALGLLAAVLPRLAAAQRHPAPAGPPPDAPAQLYRTELQLDPDEDDVLVQALPHDTAVVLLVRHQQAGRRRPRYVFQHYGANLRLRREAELTVPDDYPEAPRLCAEPGRVYALFRAPSPAGRLLAVGLDLPSGQLTHQQFDTKLSRDIVSLRAMGGRLLATVALADQQHQTALLLNVGSGQFQFVPAVYEPLSAELTSVADRHSQRAAFVLSQSNGRKQRLLLKRFSAEHGQLLSSELVQTESDRSLLTAQLSSPADSSAGPRLLAGTYALRDPRYAQGLFVTDLSAPRAAAAPDAPAHPALRFYDFRRLRHFFDYLNPSRQARLRERAARRDAREASPLRWHYHLLLHELLPQPGGEGYVLLAEAYEPLYNNYNAYNTLGGYSPVTSPLLTTGRTYAPYPGAFGSPGLAGGSPLGRYGSSGLNRGLAGFRTTHVLACGFDARGNLLWDNVFVVEAGMVRTDPEEAVQPLLLADGQLVLAYLLDNELHYKRIRQSEPAPNDTKLELQTALRPGVTEKVLEVRQPDVFPWAQNQLLATGFQRIRPQGAGPERQVFFLQALKF